MKKSTVILVWGGITGIVSAIFYYILYSTDMENTGLRYFNLLIIFLGILIGTLQYRDKTNGGYLTFGQGYAAGILICLVFTVIITIATVILLQLHPDFIDKIRELSRDKMINKGLSDEQIDIAMQYVRRFTTPLALIVLTIFGTIFYGAILSLVTSAMLVKKKPPFEDMGAGEAPAGEKEITN